ncbi:DUF4145 domain-containing protein [Paraburkholderia sp. IW21]|uniref:DUF4145 domain-containing protein n=1 Tax=Paraburkholderia sp. IW21 TaxID=3242488 RepID=UPI00352025A8
MHRLDSLTDELFELRQEIRLTFQLAEIDPRMTLTRTRRVLEYVVNEVYRRHFNEDPGTRPLENLLQRLIKEHLLPPKIATYASGIREMGNLGTHGRGDEILPSDAQHSLDQLVVILLWYFEQERPDSLSASTVAARPAQTTAKLDPSRIDSTEPHRPERNSHETERRPSQPLSTRIVTLAAGGFVAVAGVGYAAYIVLAPSPPAAPVPIKPVVPTEPSASGAAAQTTPPRSPTHQSQEKPTLEGDMTQVLDSSAVIVAGKIVNLYGLRGADGSPAMALQQYVNSQGARLACFARPGNTYQCFAQDQDIGEQALRHGWARTRKHAPQPYIDAEREAHAARRGVWAS